MFCISNQQWSGLHGDTSQRWTMRALNIRLGGAELGNTAEITNINKSYIINLWPRMIKAPFLDNTWHIQFSHVSTRHIPLCDEELGQRAWFGFISSRSDLLHMPTFASVLLFRVRKKVEPAWSHHVSHHVASRGKNWLWTRAWTERRAPEPWAELLRLSRFRQERWTRLNQVEPDVFLQTDGKMREMRVPALSPWACPGTGETVSCTSHLWFDSWCTGIAWDLFQLTVFLIKYYQILLSSVAT